MWCSLLSPNRSHQVSSLGNLVTVPPIRSGYPQSDKDAPSFKWELDEQLWYSCRHCNLPWWQCNNVSPSPSGSQSNWLLGAQQPHVLAAWQTTYDILPADGQLNTLDMPIQLPLSLVLACDPISSCSALVWGLSWMNSWLASHAHHHHSTQQALGKFPGSSDLYWTPFHPPPILLLFLLPILLLP